ncbi:MAG: SbcC/MukB-like Walker B domain-containing protein, partial [Bacteroidota bacterium]
QLGSDQLSEQKVHDKAVADLKTIAQQRATLADRINHFDEQFGGQTTAEVEQALQQLEVEVPAKEASLSVLEANIKFQTLSERISKGEAMVVDLQTQEQATTKQWQEALAVQKRAEKVLDDAIIQLNGLRVTASLHEHKMNLKPGEVCPVCGSTEHPALATYQPVVPSRIQAQEQIVEQRKVALAETTKHIDEQQINIAALNKKLVAATTRIAELVDQRGTITEATSGGVLADLTAARERLVTELTQARNQLQRLQQLRIQLPKLREAQLADQTAKQRQQALQKEVTQLATNLEKRKQELTATANAKEQLIGKHSVEDCRRMLREKEAALLRSLATAEAAEQETRSKLVATTERDKVLEEQLAASTQEQSEVQDRVRPGLAKIGLDEMTARQQLLEAGAADTLRKILGELQQQLVAAKTFLDRQAIVLKDAQAAVKELPPQEALREQLEAHDLANREINRDIGGLTLQLQQDDDRRQQLAAQRAALADLKIAADRWARLNDLIGSADGKKFRSYAQSITLQQLIEVGNEHLARINPRYRMAYDPPVAGGPEKLEMVIIDQYQNDNRRTIFTLSGGESFLISLALALGLSDLASGKSLIQSLFIDEGFGTLDGKTLDQAMTTLEQLQAQGKTIGLISHVPQLRERIHCQIQLESVGDGFSRIIVVDA